jgi:hypothetical protein
VRVPEEAGIGPAKVTFSFDSWKEVRVAATTIEVPVVKPERTASLPAAFAQ